MGSENVAKTVFLSSFFTIIILLLVVFIAREPIFSYIRSEALAEVVLPERGGLQVHENKVVSTIESVNAAVVSVMVTKDVPVYERYYETIDPWGIFGGYSIPRVREKGTEEREVGGGSGFIVSNDGMIVTNRHVVEDTDARYYILMNDGVSYDVEVMARDPELDIAILKITEPLEKSLTYVTFGDSEALQLGETVIAIGNALAEFRNSVSVGVVSGLSRSIVASDSMGRSEQLDQVIQTDAAINPGNSGGPLLNLQGEVVGVNVATSRGAENIGFALPAHVVEGVVESVREHGEIIRPYLGIRYVMLTEAIAEANELAVNYGALIIRGDERDESAVLPGSPAAKAGIKENNIILSIDGEEIRERNLSSILRSKEVGQEVELRIIAEGEEKTVSVVLEKAL
jgi:serine protease Do